MKVGHSPGYPPLDKGKPDMYNLMPTPFAIGEAAKRNTIVLSLLGSVGVCVLLHVATSRSLVKHCEQYLAHHLLLSKHCLNKIFFLPATLVAPPLHGSAMLD